jgi:subtilisin
MIPDSALMCGLNWVIKHTNTIEVVNMSLSGIIGVDEPAKALSPCGARARFREHEAICKKVRRAVTTVVAAGNDSIDTAMVVPAAYPEVITVSAMADFDGQPGGLATIPETCQFDGVEQWDDHVAWFSNSGVPVDIAAPGVCVTGTFPGSQYAFGDGTSFSTPFVARAAALYISTHRDASPAQVQAALVAAGEPGPIPGDTDGDAEPVLDIRGL